jgi:outer membrane protein TolC
MVLGQPAEKIVLDLDKALELALENNFDLVNAKLDKDIADEQVKEAYGTSLFPSIDGNVNYMRALKQGVIIIDAPGFSGSFPSGTKNTLTGSVSVEQPLFTGAMFLAVKIAKTYADFAEKGLYSTKADVKVSVEESYYNVLLAKELVKLGELNLELSKKNLDDTESMYNAGIAAEYDYLTANVQYRNLIPALTEVKNQLRIGKNNLRILLGLDLNTELIIDDSLHYSIKKAVSLDEGASLLLKRNHLIQQLEMDVKLKDLNSSYEFSKYFPELNLSGTWQAQAQENDDKSFSRWFYTNSVNVGLNLKVPIFNGFATASRVEQAEIDHKKSLAELNKTKLNLKNQLENVLLSIKKSKEQVEAYELNVEQTFRGYEIATKRFNTGLGTQLEVTDALVDFTQAKVNYLTSIRDYHVYNANLQSLLGNL